MILVTGATGTVGAEVVKQLVEAGAPLKVAARNLPKAEEKARAMGWGIVEIVYLDYEKPETFAAAFTDVDRLFLMASLELPDVKALMNPLVDAAKQAGVRHVVMHTGMGVEYDGSSSARLAEKHLEESGLGYTFLRPNWFMQNFNVFFLSDIKREEGLKFPAGEGRISFVDVRDIAAVGVAALTQEGQGHNGKAYTLTGGQPLDFYEVAATMSQATGRTLPYTPLSDDEARQMWRAAGWPDGDIDMILQLFRPVQKSMGSMVSPDVEHALGRAPIPFERYAHDYAHYWK
jgi:uncharacterized protein YbjT (DUF2867 family)